MAVFAYKALDATGRSMTGSVPAGNRLAAMDSLASQGLTPLTVEEVAAGRGAAVKPPPKASGRVRPAEAESFVRELSNLLAGGVSLSRALMILARETSRSAVRQQWTAIHDDVVGGASLAEAMSRWPGTFAPVQIAMIKAGETGSFLEVVLSQIADFRGRERDLKGKVKGALIYPAFLGVMCVGVLTFLLIYFIPKFSALFAKFKASLPLLTQMVLAASNAVTHYGLICLVVVVLAVLAVRRAMTSQAGRRYFERFVLKVPALGAVLSRFALVRFCRMLGTLLEAGVPLVTALRVAREALGNQSLADAVSVSIDQVQRGVSLAQSLTNCPQLFPASITEIIAVAEESGRLGKELVRLADANETELDRRLRTLVTLAEPVMLFVMAALVGTVVIGMLLPVFTLQEYIH